MEKLIDSTLGALRGEKRPLDQENSLRILAQLSQDRNGDDGPSPALSYATSDDEEEDAKPVSAAVFQPPPPSITVPELHEALSEEENGEGKVTTGEVTSMQALKRVLEAEQKTHIDHDELGRSNSSSSSSANGKHDGNEEEDSEQKDLPISDTDEKDIETTKKPRRGEEVRSPMPTIQANGPREVKFESDEFASARPEEEEKSDIPNAATGPLAPHAAAAAAAAIASSPRSDKQSPRSLVHSPSTVRTASEADAGDEALIFKGTPVIANIEIEYRVDSFNVGHFNFVLDMRYEEQRWRVLCHRQNLLEFHTNLKSIRLQKQMQTRLSIFNPLRLCFGQNKRSQEAELIDSMAEHPDSSIKRMPSTKRLSTLLHKKHTLEDAIKEIHFPRTLLTSDRPHLFQKNMNLNEFNPQTEEIMRQLKSSVLSYLTKVLESKLVRNLPCTLELFRCSALSFDKALGPSIIEGWVKFQKHSPSLGAVTWHTCRAACVVCNCACVPINNSKRYTAWIVIKGSFAAFLKKPLDPMPMFVLLFDTGFEVLKGFSTTGRRKHIYLHSNTSVADLTFASRNEKKLWATHLKLENTKTSWQCRDHPHGAFAPEREDRCFAKYLVDGEEYFTAVADGLENAYSEIFISGWWVTPDVVLKRGTSEGNAYWTLRAILMRKAQQGVRVHVLMFKEVEVAIALNSRFQELRLKCPNIFVLRHPNFTLGGSWYWSHHEKLVVCDSAVAFMGGLDLCWGRFDNESHSLVDNPLENLWPNLDYYNPRIQDIPDPRQIDHDVLDKDNDPRMPWHDVACQLSGPPASDLARHFVHQWNFSIISKSGSRTDLPLLIPKDFPMYPSPESDHVKVKTQILRSLPSWSGGPEGREEMSIQDAYVSAIGGAQRYVYIENQFFVSGLQGDDLIVNRISEALYQRISRAAAEKKDFRVVVFIPLLPAFEGAVDDSGQAALRQVLFWEYRTICRGEERRSLWQMLEDNPDVKDPSRYLSFFSLRTFDKSQASERDENPKIFTEMVYIHSKIMIVDDHITFIGSANINDRSMTGKRDSELCTKIMDTVFLPDAMLRGEPWPLAGEFARGLRMRLFEEHFGQFLPTEVLEDFVLPENFEKLRALARSNTECFEKVFNLVPSDRIQTFGDLKRNGNTGSRPPEAVGTDPTLEEEEEDFMSDTTASLPETADFGSKLKRLRSFSSLDKNAPGESFREKIVHLNGVYGHVVEFPLRFLSRAKKLKPTGGVISDQIFT